MRALICMLCYVFMHINIVDTGIRSYKLSKHVCQTIMDIRLHSPGFPPTRLVVQEYLIKVNEIHINFMTRQRMQMLKYSLF